MHLGKVIVVFREVCVYLVCKFSKKQLLNSRNNFLSHCFRNLSLTIVWYTCNLDLSGSFALQM